jgi:hypothetical protein
MYVYWFKLETQIANNLLQANQDDVGLLLRHIVTCWLLREKWKEFQWKLLCIISHWKTSINNELHTDRKIDFNSTVHRTPFYGTSYIFIATSPYLRQCLVYTGGCHLFQPNFNERTSSTKNILASLSLSLSLYMRQTILL